MFVFKYNRGRCEHCNASSGLLTVYQARYVPARPELTEAFWSVYSRAWCVDRVTCAERRSKAELRSRRRRGMFVLAEPKAPDAPRGTCRWCGELLTGGNASRRNYCYPEHDGRDCRYQELRSRAWTARHAVAFRGDPCCVDCGSDGPWEADHQVALEDGGEHTLENLVRRCVDCHRAKTARENSHRAAARRARQRATSGQLSL